MPDPDLTAADISAALHRLGRQLLTNYYGDDFALDGARHAGALAWEAARILNRHFSLRERPPHA